MDIAPSREVVDLSGLVLADAASETTVDLGALVGPTLLTLIRHRY